MKALLSKESAILVVIGKPCVVYRANIEQTTLIEKSEMHLVFSGCSDVVLVNISDVANARDTVTEAWACDRAMRLFVFLIDPLETADDIKEYAECVEELLPKKEVEAFVRNRLWSRPLNIHPEVESVLAATSELPSTRRIFVEFIAAQNVILRVSSAFDRIHEGAFGGEQEKSDCRYALVADGIFYKLVAAISASEDISFLKLRILSRYRQYDSALSKWIAILQPGLEKASIQRVIAKKTISSQENDSDEYEIRASGRWQPDKGRIVLENVKVQRNAIIQELKLGHLDRARQLADDLVLDQQSSSKPEHIAMTLDYLSQEAKELGATEVQLEWAERAYRINPADPLTSGHHADALIGAGRVLEAETAIHRSEELGNLAFAANMRARILRIKGMYSAARDIYIKTTKDHADDPEIWRSFAGAAECLRDLNRLEEAKSEYNAMVQRWPNNTILRSGLASTLMDLGDFPQAIKYFGTAIRNNGGIVPKSGRATAYKLAGNYDEAIRLYDECAQEAPNSEAVFCGRAEVFKVKGDLDGALAAYNLAIERAPFSIVAISGRAEVLEELLLFQEAAETYKFGLQRFPKEETFEIGLARLLRRTHSLTDALSAFDRLQKQFPDNRWVAYNRADILRRLGRVDATLRAYDMLLDKWSSYKPAINAKISVLIEAGRLAEARQLLAVQQPRSADDWRQLILRAMIYKSEGNFDAAIDILIKSLNNVPFAKEKKLFRSTLASFNMERGYYQTAARQVEGGDYSISNVIAMHAYAVSSRRLDNSKALNLYNKIIDSSHEVEIKFLSREIARRFRIIAEQPEKTLSWISNAEQSILLREVA